MYISMYDLKSLRETIREFLENHYSDMSNEEYKQFLSMLNILNFYLDLKLRGNKR